jgi:hypothetical protein
MNSSKNEGPEELVAELREQHPGHTDEWYAAWMARAKHYLEHGGDMAGAPSFPAEEGL